jgi:hypothetical protein
MSKSKFFVCKPYSSTISTTQCKENQIKAKSKEYKNKHLFSSCIDCKLFETSQKYNLEQIQLGEHLAKFDEIKSQPPVNYIPDRKVLVPSIIGLFL